MLDKSIEQGRNGEAYEFDVTTRKFRDTPVKVKIDDT
jgi:hypothetical protein